MRRAWLFPLACLSLSFWVNGCALFGIRGSERYDERSISILTLNLFNQRIPSTLSQRNWKGDWLFRRERLELIDEQLRISRPDIVVFQELLTRRGSPSESDINILNFGALEGYEWDAELVAFHKDTQEMQYQAAAVGLPVKLAASVRSVKKFRPIGIDGFMNHTLLELDQQPILLVNISMPGNAQKVDHWYEIVKSEVKGLLKSLGICSHRLIVAGYLPGGMISAGFAGFAEALELKDTATGFCEAASDCLTSSNQNDLFMATSQGRSSAHSERIMVHRDALVSFSNVVMNKMKDRTVNGEPYGLQRLWAGRVYGWLADVRLQRCPAPDS